MPSERKMHAATHDVGGRGVHGPHGGFRGASRCRGRHRRPRQGRPNRAERSAPCAPDLRPDDIERLIDKGAEVNVSDPETDETPLHLAAWKTTEHVFERIIDKGANVNAKDKNGWTPLHLAALRRALMNRVEILVKRGAKVDAADADGDTPLHVAAARGLDETAELLLELGADVNAKAADGATPLFRAILPETTYKKMHDTFRNKSGYAGDIVGFLMENKASLAVTDKQGRTLLHAAVLARAPDRFRPSMLDPAQKKREPELLARLLAEGVPIDARDKEGNTPLHLAAARGDPDAVEFLLKKNAKTGIRNQNGLRAMDVATENRYRHIADLIRDHHATR
ncbi:MAG: hypothetical protein AMS16_07030 [Planctomycetes bacterium DG_58]|nr:MAG: hypothetical protein AMS16_07030 [Planctomycetes bacterium DG_58]